MRKAITALAALALPATLLAQLPDPSPRALAMGGAYSSLARGYEAIYWNPAMLATAGNKSFSIGLPHLTFETGSNTYSSNDLRDFADQNLTDEDKQYLLDQISADDSVLNLRWLLGVSPVGLTIGRFGITVGTSGDADLNIGPDAIDLALFGNARRGGPGQTYSLENSSGRAWLATTVAGSFAMPFNLPMGRVAVGVTGKYVIGNFLGRAEEISSSFGINPTFATSMSAHAVYSDFGGNFSSDSTDLPWDGPGDFISGDGNVGSGWGLDIGATWQPAGRDFTLSAALINAAGSMSWDEDRFLYERTDVSVSQDATGNVVDSETNLSLSGSAIDGDASARALRDDLLEGANFARVLRFGIALKKGMLTLAGGGHVRLSEGLDRQTPRLIGGGAELNLLSIVRIRGGAATDFANTLTLSGGLGLNILGLNIDASAAHIGGSARPGVVVSLGVGLMW
jgi:hypothetical protein